jgi:hypothetical protein
MKKIFLQATAPLSIKPGPSGPTSAAVCFLLYWYTWHFAALLWEREARPTATTTTSKAAAATATTPAAATAAASLPTATTKATTTAPCCRTTRGRVRANRHVSCCQSQVAWTTNYCFSANRSKKNCRRKFPEFELRVEKQLPVRQSWRWQWDKADRQQNCFYSCSWMKSFNESLQYSSFKKRFYRVEVEKNKCFLSH